MKRLEPADERWIDDARRAAHRPAPPPSVAQVQAEGCIGFHIHCNAGPIGVGRCGHWRLIRWEDIDLPPDLPFPAIRTWIRARCTKCGSRSFSIVPDATHEKRPGPL